MMCRTGADDDDNDDDTICFRVNDGGVSITCLHIPHACMVHNVHNARRRVSGDISVRPAAAEWRWRLCSCVAAGGGVDHDKVRVVCVWHHWKTAASSTTEPMCNMEFTMKLYSHTFCKCV